MLSIIKKIPSKKKKKKTGNSIRFLVFTDSECATEYVRPLNGKRIIESEALRRCATWRLCQSLQCRAGKCKMFSPTCELKASAGSKVFVIIDRVPTKIPLRSSLLGNLKPLEDIRNGRKPISGVVDLPTCRKVNSFKWRDAERRTSSEYPFIHVTVRDKRNMNVMTQIDPIHKIVIFRTPKVMSTNAYILGDRLIGHKDVVLDTNLTLDVYLMTSSKLRPRMSFLHLNLEQANQVMNDPTWKKVLFVRDPAERFLSMWMDKIVGMKLPFRNFFGNNSFSKQVRYLTDAGPPPAGNGPLTNIHYRQQFYINHVYKFLPHFDFIAWGTSANAETMLKKYGLWKEFGAPELWPYGFMRNSGTHKTDSTSKFDEHYTPELLRKVKEAYKLDYGFLEYVGLLDRNSTPQSGSYLTSFKQACCWETCFPIS